MKRKIMLVLAAILLLSSVGCSQNSVHEEPDETTNWATEATLNSTQPMTDVNPQATLPPSETEQTQAPDFQPTQPEEPIQTEQPSQTEMPTQPAQPTQSNQPTQLTQPIQTVQPTQPIQSTQPTQSTQNSTVQSTQQPTRPTENSVIKPNTNPMQSETIPATKPEGIQTTIPATEKPTTPSCDHDYQQTYTKAATCTAVGSKKFVCRKCGAVMRQEIPLKAHSYAAATCLKPKTCTMCSRTEGTALGHSYGANHQCIRCSAKDPSVSPESMPVTFVATVRSDEGKLISGITVTVYTSASGSSSAGSAVTNQKGVANIALRAGSTVYTVKLSNVPDEYQVQASYTFNSPQVTINLKTRPVRTDPNDHSKARYEEGDKMMEFTMTDVDGKTYKLSELLKENKLVILDFWYVNCNPCKQEFPYFEAALKAYGDDIVILAVDPFDSAADIRKLRDEMGLSFPVFRDSVGLSGGFQVASYPTTVFIDSTGTIRKIHRNSYSDEASFLRAIAAYL